MLQGTVTKVTADGSVFTLQADDGRDYDISQSDIRDVEVEIEEDVQIAIAYIGEPLGLSLIHIFQHEDQEEAPGRFSGGLRGRSQDDRYYLAVEGRRLHI